MAAVAGGLLAVGSLLFLAGFLTVVALCRKAFGEGAEVEAEVKALSLSLRFHVRPRRSPGPGSGGETPEEG